MSGKQVTCIDNADGKYEQILICSTHDIVLRCYTIDILRHQSSESKLFILKNCSVHVLLAYWKAVLSVHSLHSWVPIHSDCKLGCGFTEHQMFSPSVQEFFVRFVIINHCVYKRALKWIQRHQTWLMYMWDSTCRIWTQRKESVLYEREACWASIPVLICRSCLLLWFF